MPNRCARALLRRLAESGAWMGRDELAADIGWHEAVVDEALADLQADGTVLWNQRSREYRLGGTVWARRALKSLVTEDGLKRAAVVGHSPGSGARPQPMVHVGLAQRAPAPGGGEQLVMCELDMPHPGGLDGMLKLAAAVQTWCRGAEGDDACVAH